MQLKIVKCSDIQWILSSFTKSIRFHIVLIQEIILTYILILKRKLYSQTLKKVTTLKDELLSENYCLSWKFKQVIYLLALNFYNLFCCIVYN